MVFNLFLLLENTICAFATRKRAVVLRCALSNHGLMRNCAGSESTIILLPGVSFQGLHGTKRKRMSCSTHIFDSSSMACSPKALPFTYDTPWISNTSVFDMTLCVIDVSKGSYFFLENLPTCYSYGQPVWCSTSLLCMIGWHKTPVHQSMDSFCTLPSTLLFYDLTTHTTEVLALEVVCLLQS